MKGPSPRRSGAGGKLLLPLRIEANSCLGIRDGLDHGKDEGGVEAEDTNQGGELAP